MRSKILLTASAVLLFGVGLGLDFLPQEVGTALGVGSTPQAVLLLQILAAAFLGVGFMNWLSKANPMGGIYSRPLGLQNILLFGVSAIPLDKAAVHGVVPRPVEWIALAFTVFAVAFGWLVFFHDPIADQAAKHSDS